MRTNIFLIVFFCVVLFSCTKEIINYNVEYNSFGSFDDLSYPPNYKLTKSAYILDTIKTNSYKLYKVYNDVDCTDLTLHRNYKILISFSDSLNIDSLNWRNIDNIINNENIYLLKSLDAMYHLFMSDSYGLYRNEFSLFNRNPYIKNKNESEYSIYELKNNLHKINHNLFLCEFENKPQYFLIMLVKMNFVNSKYFKLDCSNDYFAKVIVPFY